MPRGPRATWKPMPRPTHRAHSDRWPPEPLDVREAGLSASPVARRARVRRESSGQWAVRLPPDKATMTRAFWALDLDPLFSTGKSFHPSLCLAGEGRFGTTRHFCYVAGAGAPGTAAGAVRRASLPSGAWHPRRSAGHSDHARRGADPVRWICCMGRCPMGVATKAVEKYKT
jgi:hypothetical protein